MQHMHSLQGHQCLCHPHLVGARLPFLSVRRHRRSKAARLASNVNGRTSSASERETGMQLNRIIQPAVPSKVLDHEDPHSSLRAGKRRSASSTPAQKTAETKPQSRQSSGNSSAKATPQQQGNTFGTNQMSLQAPAAGPSPSSQTATLPPSEAPSSASKAPSPMASLTSKAAVSCATASSQTEVGSASRAPSTNGKPSNASSRSNLKTANKPCEAEADVPDKRSDKSVVMPSSAAAQAATGTSVATSESAVRADRQAIGGRPFCKHNSSCQLYDAAKLMARKPVGLFKLTCCSLFTTSRSHSHTAKSMQSPGSTTVNRRHSEAIASLLVVARCGQTQLCQPNATAA